jgi:4-alpha-glucanotransferase
MRFPRSSGILLHITSLPNHHGIGDLGVSAYRFAEFLVEAGQKIWQVLPVGPTGYADSPYQCFSAFAGNPLLIDLEALRERNLLTAADLGNASNLPSDYVDYGQTIQFKYAALQRAGKTFLSDSSEADLHSFKMFCHSNASWLEDYALFMACKAFHEGAVWTSWEPALRQRQAPALKEWGAKLSHEIELCKYWQYEFFRQWEQLKTHCHRLGIRIMGDIPVYVAHDSADVWANPQLFQLDPRGKPTVVGGVPPDYFSATGQLWGNPIYRWDDLARSGYQWWIDRFRASLKLFDLARLDHFRGFEAYWEIPADASTAVSGKWVKAPGAELFRVLESTLGELPIVAENLGVITPEVEAIRRQFGFPGMSLLQFAFGNDPQGPSFRPHNYSRELVAYTGGHDNDTTVGWWTSTGLADSTRTVEDVRQEHEFTRAYLGIKDEPINWAFIRTVLASVADTAVIPLQDVLGLGSEARMNRPGTVTGNWKWRYASNALTEEIARRLKQLTLLYDR